MRARAKINLALVVGPVRDDGLHEIATVYQRVELHDTLELEPADRLAVEGFAEDTLVHRALAAVAETLGVEPSWRALIDKRIPVAAGLGGGSSDAAAAIRLANELLGSPLEAAALHELARGLGADVPFFLAPGPQLGTEDGTKLTPVALPQDYVVLLVLPEGVAKESTASVYDRFSGGEGFEERKGVLLAALAADDLAGLPPNDLASSPIASRLLELRAFRADVSGAGPAVFGLFRDRAAAVSAQTALSGVGRSWITRPAW
jgi:4-diphosphocytidyl-2-C-methyl-D-erythritol kinase